MKFKEINTDEFSFSPFKVIGKDWMLITAQKDNKVNTMTASWGGLGVMWGEECSLHSYKATALYKRIR